MICLLWRGQLRVSEALALKPADFDAEKCTVRVLNGKGRKSRVVVIDRQAADVVQTWLEVRKGLGHNGHATIFCTLQGRPRYAAFSRHDRAGSVARRYVGASLVVH